MSLAPEFRSALDKIGPLSMTTLDGDTMHSRIISIVGTDDDGIYFFTMDVKPFYRQLTQNPKIALCGIWPSAQKTGKNAAGQPTWEPGFTLRLTGETREVSEQEVKEKTEAGSSIHEYFLEDAQRYPAMKLFCIHKGKGEIFDFDFELEHRDHKVLRTRLKQSRHAHRFNILKKSV